jgi:protein O-mannosyl-transferase
MTLRSWGKALILVLAVSVVYLNSFAGVFQFDDYKMIVNYARAHSIASWLYYFSHHIRPLLKLSYTFNWISGLGLFGFHIVNLAIHIINTLLVYFISREFLFRTGERHSANGAFLCALLFGLHPIQTEAVTYICGRSVSLMTLFYLGSMLTYIKGEETRRSFLTYVLSPALFIIAVLTRETALTLPLALLLWNICSEGQQGTLRKSLRSQAVHWSIFMLIVLAVLLHYKYEQLLIFSYGLRGVGENLFSQFNGLGYLLSRLVMINGLNIDPDIPAFSSWTIPIIMKAVMLAALLAGALVAFRKWRWISFGVLWFFLHLIPTNSIIPRLDIANERHMYLPAIGLFLVIAVFMEKVRIAFYERHHLLHALFMALFIILGYFTWARNKDYRSEVTFWKATILQSPHKARCYNNLGFAYELEGSFQEAKDAYGHAVELDPAFKLAKNNLKKMEAVLERDK